MDKQKNLTIPSKEAPRDDEMDLHSHKAQPDTHKNVEIPKEDKKESEKQVRKQIQEEEAKKTQAKEKQQQDATEETEEKEQKRQQAINQSAHFMQEFGESDHTELSPIQIVQLIVAERIYWLGSRLNGEEQLEIEELFATEQQLDFLSSLADKLAEPDTEVPPEVDEVYQQVIEEIAHPVKTVSNAELIPHSHTEIEDDTILATLAENIHPEEDLTIRGESIDTHQQHGAAIAFAITSLALACQHARHHTISDEIDSGSDSIGTGYGYMAPAPSGSGHLAPHMVHRTTPLTPVAREAMPGSPSIATRIPIQRGSLLPLAAAAYSAASRSTPASMEVADRLESYSTSPQNARSEAPSGGGFLASSGGGSGYSSSGYRAPSLLVPERQSVHEARPMATAMDTVIAPSKPVEFWQLDDLLRVAHDIPLGHGRYLDSAFRHAEIDQEGLVKIIKDWKKGKPYLQTFEKQRTSLASKRKSIETLPATSTPSDTQATTSHDEAPEPSSPQAQDLNQVSDPLPITAKNKAETSDSAQTPMNTTKEGQDSNTVFKHAILIVISVLLFAAFLFFTL